MKERRFEGRAGLRGTALAAVLLLGLPLGGRAQLLPQLEIASVNSSGIQGDRGSRSPSLSYDGRFIAFSSGARNLVPDDENGTTDIFVRDRIAGTTERVSVDSFGQEADGFNEAPRISSTGRFVVFLSNASNLVPGDANGRRDVFVHDRETRTTERVSVGLGGLDPDDASFDPHISADGRWVVFSSFASNLVAGDASDGSDIFLVDRLSGSIERVSVAFDGGDLFGPSIWPSMSDDGRWVAFNGPPGADPNDPDTGGIYLFDRMTHATRVAVYRLDGLPPRDVGAPLLSGDGRWLTFSSSDVGLVAEPDIDAATDVFLFGLESGERILITPTDDKRRRSLPEDISADGRIVAFLSDSRTLLPGAGFKRGDVYTFDRISGEITRANRTATASANHCTNEGRVSGDGHWVAFKSSATNLDPDDSNGEEDVFVGLAGFTCLQDEDCQTNEFCEADAFGVCDVPTRTCTFEHKPDGTPCEDENPCTSAQSCRSGRCRPDAVVTCPAIDSCHGPGTCDPLEQVGFCTNPRLPEGTPCSLPPTGVACSLGAICNDEGICGHPLGSEDPDDDQICSWDDICPEVPDPRQADLDGDGAGDACDPLDATIRLERASLRWSSPIAAADGSLRIGGVLEMPIGVAPLPEGEPIAVRFTDGVRTDRSIEFAASECRSEGGAVRCRRAAGPRARLVVKLADSPSNRRFYRVDLRARGLDLSGPFQPPIALEVLSSPPVRGAGIDRAGSILDCRSSARGLRCVAR